MLSTIAPRRALHAASTRGLPCSGGASWAARVHAGVTKLSAATRHHSTEVQSKTKVLLLGSSDTSVMQRIRCALGGDGAFDIAVELSASTASVSSAVVAHKPSLVVCMDTRTAAMVPGELATNPGLPCLVMATRQGSTTGAATLEVVRTTAPVLHADSDVAGSVLASCPIPGREPSQTRSDWYKRTTGDVVASTVIDVVRKHHHGMFNTSALLAGPAEVGRRLLSPAVLASPPAIGFSATNDAVVELIRSCGEC